MMQWKCDRLDDLKKTLRCDCLRRTTTEDKTWSDSTNTIPLIPRAVAPAVTALSAYSIWTRRPLGLNVVNEKE